MSDARGLPDQNAELKSEFRKAVERAAAKEAGEEAALIADNVARLRACPGPHRFRPLQVVDTPGLARNRSQVCAACGGIATADQYAFYLMGLKHGVSHGRTDRPRNDPGVRLAGAPDEHGPDGGRGRPGGGGGPGQPGGEHAG